MADTARTWPSLAHNAYHAGCDDWHGASYTGRGGPQFMASLIETILYFQPLDNVMLYTLALILIIAWLLGLVSSYTMGGFIHILLVVALVLLLVRVIQGKQV